MDERLARIVGNLPNFEQLAQFETNARDRQALDDDLQDAIRVRSGELGRALITARTGIDLAVLSPAEEKIVRAVSEYVGVMKRRGRDATRTFLQLKNRGLVGAAEASVSKSEPTQGFQTLNDAGRGDVSFEQIVLDHPDEFSPRAAWFARRTLGIENDSPRPPTQTTSLTQRWTETLIAWLKDRSQNGGGRIPIFTHADVAAVLGMDDMHKYGRVLGNIQSRIDFACYRAALPPLGLAAERPYHDAWSTEGRDWDFPVVHMQAAAQSRSWSATDFDGVLTQTEGLSGQAYVPWRAEMAAHEQRVKDWAFGLEISETLSEQVDPPTGNAPRPEAEAEAEVESAPTEAPYWVFVCNPKKWAIDRFLEARIERDSWGVRKSDRTRFAPGQLGLIRVGVDGRNAEERLGRPRLDAGIYAICMVESASYPATGATGEFWAEGAAREDGWPTVRIRYLRVYPSNPLTIERLRAELPGVSKFLLDGLQASSFPISSDDFRAVLALMGEDPDELPEPDDSAASSADELALLERRYINANPEVKERVSKSVERGPIGNLVKRLNGHRCQLCEALGRDPHSFRKRDGQPYVEVHHIMPVSSGQVGTLSASNIMTLCANHHREMHYGNVRVQVGDLTFEIEIGGVSVSIRRLAVTHSDD